jgi:hypothetical protein
MSEGHIKAAENALRVSGMQTGLAALTRVFPMHGIWDLGFVTSEHVSSAILWHLVDRSFDPSRYAALPPAWAKERGVCQLSCSS